MKEKETLTFTLDKPFPCFVEEEDHFTISFKNSGTVWVEGIEGSCVEFDKTRYISVVKGKSASVDAFTITVWVYPYSLDGSRGVVGSGWRHPALSLSSNLRCGITFEKAEGKEEGYYLNGGKIETDKWQHIAVTFDTTTGELKFYINGENTKTVTNVKGEMFKGEMVKIGYYWSVGTIYRNWGIFHGKIDEAKLYYRPLSPEEIKKASNFPLPSQRAKTFPILEVRAKS